MNEAHLWCSGILHFERCLPGKRRIGTAMDRVTPRIATLRERRRRRVPLNQPVKVDTNTVSCLACSRKKLIESRLAGYVLKELGTRTGIFVGEREHEGIDIAPVVALAPVAQR